MAHLLVVEDDEDIRFDLCELLTDLGYRVAAAANGHEALAYVRGGNRPRLILLDLMMPGMDGWQLRIELLKDRALADIPVVLLSGAGDLKKESMALGALAYLTKPFDTNQLLSIVAPLLGDPP